MAEIRERRQAVNDLEHSLMELHQIFLDMAVLVEAQGGLIENIAAHVFLLKRKSIFYFYRLTKPKIMWKWVSVMSTAQ